MGVTTTQTNKPFSPRGNDQSPLAYNRAKLFSGKALDFDGVNDYVDLDGFTMAGDVATIVFQAKFENDQYLLDIDTQRFVIRNTSSEGFRVFNSDSFTEYGETKRSELGFYSIVSDGTTQRAYYNGAQLGNDATITALDWDSITEISLGSNNTGTNNFFDGQIAGFKIFNTALTAAQVADLYNNPEKVVPTGVDNTALKLWLPMQEGAGTTALNGAPDALGSEEVTNSDFATDSDWTKGTGWTISGGLASSDGSQGGISGLTSSTISGLNNKGSLLLEVIVDSVTAGTLYATLQGTGGLDIINISSAGTYKVLCETGDVNAQITLGASADFVGSVSLVSLKELQNCGAISGATWAHGIGAPVAQTSVIDWNKGDYLNDGGTITEILVPQGLTSGRDLLGNLFENVRKQGALNLDGNSWAEVHDNGSLDFGTGSFSLEAWVRAKYVNKGSVFNMVISLGDNITSSNNAGLMLLNNNVPYFIYSNPGASSGSAQTEGDWIHMVGTYDETNTTLYVNGSQADQDARTASDITNGFAKLIGRDGTDLNRFYSDQIAQPRIYNRALTAEEVQRNYNAGKNTYTNS